jgi:uncharacterized protein (TIGR02611 family)
LHYLLHANPALSLTTKIVVTAVGSLVLLAGLIMMVTPGPALLMIPLGLAILATEWDWAARWLDKAKEHARRAKEKAERVDPKVRRRRLLVGSVLAAVLAGALVWYVATYDWPTYAIDGWNWVQGVGGWVPELPGM